MNQKDFAKNLFPHIHIIEKIYLLDCIKSQLPLFVIEDYNLNKRKKISNNDQKNNNMEAPKNDSFNKKNYVINDNNEFLNVGSNHNKGLKIQKYYLLKLYCLLTHIMFSMVNILQTSHLIHFQNKRINQILMILSISFKQIIR